MSDFHKYFLTNIFEGLEEKSDATPEFPDIMTIGEKVNLAKSANINALAFLEKCFNSGLTTEQSFAALDAEIAKAKPNAGAAANAGKS
jgi:hypothetical protein